MVCCSWDIPIMLEHTRSDPMEQQQDQTVMQRYTNGTWNGETQIGRRNGETQVSQNGESQVASSPNGKSQVGSPRNGESQVGSSRNGESQVSSQVDNATLQYRENDQPKPHQQPKIILFWTSCFNDPGFYFGLGHEPFMKYKCPVNNCITTNDRALLKQASAILFHNRNVHPKTVFPSPRFSNQSYVFFLLEPPPSQGISLTGFNSVYNLTMTYRRDSDIEHKFYGTFIPGSSALPDKNVTEIVAGKKKLVAWMVSHCQTQTKRELYVRELQKHIGVDIYGKCGPLKCPKTTDCYAMLEKDYKFYLSFENCVCKDYVTEKLFNVLPRYVVPVVLGGANYSAVAPPHSVINVQDYTSPKHLADYLHMLAADDVKYRKYFEWKRQYSITRKSGFCKLCEMINEPYTSPKIATDLHKWWNTDAKCDHGLVKKLIH